MYKITKWCAVITDDRKDWVREVTEQEKKDMPFEFRLLDADGEVYGYGISSNSDDESAFAPLDRYQGDYGCTDIQYKNKKGVWESL